jgi:hypothetical protein
MLMRRYAVRRLKADGCDEEEFYWYPQSQQPLTVFESSEQYEDTGLIDEHGNEIIRFVGVLPIGFLADHSEE